MFGVVRLTLPIIAGSMILLVSSGFAQNPPRLRLAEVQDVGPTSYRVELNLDPAKDTFSGSVRISLMVRKPLTTIWLNTSQLSLHKIELLTGSNPVEGTIVADADNFTGIKFPVELPSGNADLLIDYDGHIRSNQAADIFMEENGGDRYLFTQI
jgi:cytosol alanyl aminopeptidase